MLGLLQSEWLKLTKRPLAWILLAVFLVLMLLQYLQFYLISVVFAPVLDPIQVEEVRRRLAFPGAFGAAFSHINGLGGVFAVVLAAAMVGGDYSWGTLRVYLPRHPNRVRYLLAKVITLLLGLLAAMVATLLLGMLAAIALGGLVGGAAVPTLASMSILPVAMGRALLVLSPYVLITVAATVYGRSLIFGLVAGLLFQFADIGFGALALFRQLGGIWQLIYSFMVQANIVTLTTANSVAFGLNPAALDRSFDPTSLPSMPQALLTVLVYCGVSLGSALYLFDRRDITTQ